MLTLPQAFLESVSCPVAVTGFSSHGRSQSNICHDQCPRQRRKSNSHKQNTE
ncbi:hypothetical protein X975_11704, partial [Stegodyphus mimosarum]